MLSLRMVRTPQSTASGRKVRQHESRVTTPREHERLTRERLGGWSAPPDDRHGLLPEAVVVTLIGIGFWAVARYPWWGACGFGGSSSASPNGAQAVRNPRLPARIDRRDNRVLEGPPGVAAAPPSEPAQLLQDRPLLLLRCPPVPSGQLRRHGLALSHRERHRQPPGAGAARGSMALSRTSSREATNPLRAHPR